MREIDQAKENNFYLFREIPSESVADSIINKWEP